MANRIKLDSRGIEEVAKSREMKRAIEDLAESVADNARSQGVTVGALHGSGEMSLPVEVSVYETDRARASVTLAHPAGLAAQAKRGVLTRAASAAGLTVQGS